MENQWISNGMTNPGKMENPSFKLTISFQNGKSHLQIGFSIFPGLVIPFEIHLFSIFLDFPRIQFKEVRGHLNGTYVAKEWGSGVGRHVESYMVVSVMP